MAYLRGRKGVVPMAAPAQDTGVRTQLTRCDLSPVRRRIPLRERSIKARRTDGKVRRIDRQRTATT
ncbi:hypothetical protein HY375_02640 [Candidatus Berkelbacteria bacterium]|nr:hypothetical protein [Candidatus Berkelbacteria bacterium]